METKGVVHPVVLVFLQVFGLEFRGKVTQAREGLVFSTLGQLGLGKEFLTLKV